MAECNRCTLRRIERLARARGQAVTLLNSSCGGVDVYVHEPESPPPADATPSDLRWAVWFMELPKECAC